MALLVFGLLVVVAQLSHGQMNFGNTGFNTAGAGFGSFSGSQWPQWGSQGGSQWGSQWGMNSVDDTTITCAFEESTIAGSLTLRRSQPAWGGWGWGQSGRSLTGTFVVRTDSTVMGTFSLVFTRRGRDSECSTDSLGTVLGSNVWGQRRSGWGHQWGWGSQTTTLPGVVSEITLSGNDDRTIELNAQQLTLGQLQRYAGRSLAICTSLTTDAYGRQECTTPIACCKLAYDDQNAVTPAQPTK